MNIRLFFSFSKATEQKIEMSELQNNNHMILCNLLPAHVAAHFIDGGNRSHMVLSELNKPAFNRTCFQPNKLMRLISIYPDILTY